MNREGNMKKVMVTGASGFIGWHTIQPLLDRGFQVYGVYNRTQLPLREGLHPVRMNLLDVQGVKSTVAQIQPDCLLHLAWDVNPASYVHDVSNLDWLYSSMELVKAACENGCKKVVTAGTCFEYEVGEDGGTLDEYAPLTNKSLYAASKASLYNLCTAYCGGIGIPYTHGRIFYVYGAREHEQRVVPYVIRSLLGEKEAMVSSGTQLRDYIYVQDVANAFLDIMESPLEGAVNIGMGRTTELKKLFLEIGRQLNCPQLIKLGEVPSRAGEPKRIVADNRKLVSGTGWQPAFSLEMGIQAAIRWWKEVR